MKKKTSTLPTADIPGLRSGCLGSLPLPLEGEEARAFLDRILEISARGPGVRKKMNTIQAADFFGLKPNTLEIWRCRDKGPKYIKLGRRVLYDIADLEAFARACTVETGGSWTRNHSGKERGEDI